MRAWTVGGGVVLGPEGVLLVQNRRRNGRLDWSPPGGVIDDGENLIEGLTREVTEETGLVVTRWDGPVYEIDAVAAGLGWHLRVEVHVAAEYHGELTIDDPDGIVVAAEFVDVESCVHRLLPGPRWVGEPLGEWLGERWPGSRSYRYDITGDDPRTIEIARR